MSATRSRSGRTRSPSPPPSSSSKRRRYDDDAASSSSRQDDRKDRDRHERGSDRRDRSRERERRPESGRDRERDRDSHRSSRRHDSPPREESRRSSGSSRRDRSRDRDGRRESDRDSRDYRERERGGERGGEREYREREYERERGSDRDRHRDGDSRRDTRKRQVSRSYSPEKRERSIPPPARRESPVPPPKAKPAFVSTFSSPAPPPPSASPAPAISTPASAPGSPLPGGSTDKAKDEEEKLRIKREKLEAWKAKKAKDAAAAASTPPAPSPTLPPAKPPVSLPSKPQTSTKPHLPAKPLGFHPATSSSDPAALALAAAAAITSRITPPSTLKPASSLPAKPSFSFSSTAFKPSGLKNSLALGEDDEGERRVGLVEIKGEVDMSLGGEGEEEEEDGEDLEGGVVFKKREREVKEEEDVVMGEPGNPGEDEKKAEEEEEEEEIDELEMFMSGVQAQVKSVDKEDRAKLGAAKGRKLADPEAEEEEVEEVDSEDELEKVGMKAEDILALAAKKVVKRGRELHSVDHSKIDYEPFRKAFYHAPPEVELLTPEEVEEMRLEMDGIKVRGADPPKPVAKWSYCGLPAPCIEVIKGLGYTAPTSIQSQAIPAIMSGRDIIGVAKTGSGKTMAFIAPMFRHIKDQRPIRSMEGPIAMIMTPTRELATQIHKECKPFLKALGLRASCAYGGTPLKDNIAEMKRGSEVVVCTPGRMIELLTTNSGRIINLQRITYLVLDEADRMFDMGFEPQVMKIINQIRPDRQTVLFSATFPRQMEALARKILRRPLEITVGGRSIVAPEIEQIVEVREEATKFNRLLELLGNLTNEDADARALIFVERQDAADKLLTDLLRKNYSCMSLHGGMEQVDRDQTIADFKSGVIPIVIATSVAARGLDVKQLKLVVQFDAPNHMEDYVHRAGRTGRAGNKGVCVTFVTPEQDRYAFDILKALMASSANVPPELKALAESFADKVKSGKASGAGSGFGGKGLERLDTERDAQSRAERAAYGEAAGPPKPVVDEATGEAPPVIDVADLEIEIHKGPAPDTSKGRGMVVSSLVTAKAAEQAALLAGKPAGIAKAQGVIANINAMLKAKLAGGRPGETDTSTDAARRRDPDATDYHAIVYINDYPQKARWKVTNKDTMVQLVETTGASITNKGTFYEPGKEPKEGELPKLHLLIESNDEFRVKHAISEIKRSLIEGATMALEAEQRNGPNLAPGRYTV